MNKWYTICGKEVYIGFYFKQWAIGIDWSYSNELKIFLLNFIIIIDFED